MAVEDRIFSNEAINYHIVSHVVAYLPQSDVYTLSLLNRHFHRLVTPALYRSITVTEDEHDITRRTTYVRSTDSRSSLHNCKILLQTLLTHPPLARHVVEIDIAADVWFKDTIHDIVTVVVQAQEQLLSGTVVGVSLTKVRCEHEFAIWNSNRDKSCYRCIGYDEMMVRCGRREVRELQVDGCGRLHELVILARSHGQRLHGLKRLEIGGGGSGGVGKVVNAVGESNVGVRHILRHLEELVLLYDPFWFVMNNCGVEGDSYAVKKLSIDRCLHSTGAILNNFETYWRREQNLIKSCHGLQQVRYRFSFETVDYFIQYFAKFMSVVPQICHCEVVICVKEKNFNCEFVVDESNKFLQRFAGSDLVVYNNYNECYVGK